MSQGQRISATPANRSAVIDRRLRHTEDIARDMPSRWAGGAATPALRLVIWSGNTLATGQEGIKYSASEITDVPSAYDPTTPGTAIDGVGWAQLYSDGTYLGYVLVVNDGTGGTTINFDLLGGPFDQDVGSPVETTKTVTVGGDPDTTLTVYTVKSLVG